MSVDAAPDECYRWLLDEQRDDEHAGTCVPPAGMFVLFERRHSFVACGCRRGTTCAAFGAWIDQTKCGEGTLSSAADSTVSLMPDNTVRTRLLARGLRSAQGSIRYVSPVLPNAAAGLVAKVDQQVESDYGFLAPRITLHSPSPDGMAASWVMLRETLLASGRADRGS